MRELGKRGEKSIIDSDEIICKYARLAFTHPTKKEKSNKMELNTLVVGALQLQLNAKTLPDSYNNWPSGTYVNTKIRVDNIPVSAVVCWCFAIRSLVEALDIYFEDQSNGYAFLTFSKHNLARRFLAKFNSKPIPGSDMVYRLSWAPFYQNPSIFSRHKDEAIELSDPLVCRAHEVMESSPIGAGMLCKMNDFHRTFRKELLCQTSEERRAFIDRRGVIRGFDDGYTTILCLVMVDPCVEEGVLKLIFGQYGKCIVDVPNKEGCGIVKFGDRDRAEEAFVDLENLFEQAKVCCLGWGTSLKESLADKLERHCRARHTYKGPSRSAKLALPPLHGENDRAEASKRPRSAGKSVSRSPRSAKRCRRKY